MPTETIPLPLSGLNDNDPLMIDPQYSPDLQNVRLASNRIEKRPGMTFVTASPAIPARNILQASFTNIPSGQPASQFLRFGEEILHVLGGPDLTWTEIPIVGGPDPFPMETQERFSFANTLSGLFWVSWNQRIRFYDGSVASTLLNDFDVNMTGMVLLSFANRLILVRTRELGMDHPTRVRWCADGQITAWDPATNRGAGFLEVVESSLNPLTGGFVLGDKCFLTKEREILPLVSTGDFRSPLRVGGPVVPGIGMIAPHSWAAGEFFGFFLGPNSVYKFDGASIEDVGEGDNWGVKSFLAGRAEMREPPIRGRLQAVQGVLHARDTEYWLLLPPPFGSQETGAVVMIYDYRRKRWYKDVYDGHMVDCMAEFRPAELDLFVSITLGWVQGRDSILHEVTDGIHNATVLEDFTRFSDSTINGTDREPIDGYFETRDFYAKEFSAGQTVPSSTRMNGNCRVAFKGPPGEKAFVGVSTDMGETWSEQEVTVTASGTAQAWFIRPFQTVRFRFRHHEMDENPGLGHRADPVIWRGGISYDWKPAGVVIQNA